MKRTAADLSGSQCSYDKLSYKDLQDRCRERGLATTGRVDDLVVRLLGDDAQQSDALCTVAKVFVLMLSPSTGHFLWGREGDCNVVWQGGALAPFSLLNRHIGNVATIRTGVDNLGPQHGRPPPAESSLRFMEFRWTLRNLLHG